MSVKHFCILVEMQRDFELTYASIDLQGDFVKAARREHMTHWNGVESQNGSQPHHIEIPYVEMQSDFDLTYASIDLQGDSVKYVTLLCKYNPFKAFQLQIFSLYPFSCCG